MAVKEEEERRQKRNGKRAKEGEGRKKKQCKIQEIPSGYGH